jgi:hypothetical protein
VIPYKNANRKTATVEELPDCDFCKQEGRDPPEKAEYDGRTIYGPCAYMCQEHFDKYGVGLGEGVGQKLVRPIKPECPHDTDLSLWENLSYDMDGKVIKCKQCGEERHVELDSELGGRLPFV